MQTTLHCNYYLLKIQWTKKASLQKVVINIINVYYTMAHPAPQKHRVLSTHFSRKMLTHVWFITYKCA